MRVDVALRHGTEILVKHSDTARLDAEILLSHYLGKPRSYLYAWPEVEVSESILNQFNDALSQRKTDYPVAYIIGYQEFWSLPIQVSPDVLIPRADTELLVELALSKLENIKSPKILELGTGSGAISIAIASERPDCAIIATDYSREALNIAQENQKKLDLSNINFVKSDWYQSISEDDFDLILSNPPYIDPDDPHMTTGIRHEPLQALCSDEMGMADLKEIIDKGKHHLKQSGWILLEHGYNQRKPVTERLAQAGFSMVDCIKDLAGNDRVSLGQLPNH